MLRIEYFMQATATHFALKMQKKNWLKNIKKGQEKIVIGIVWFSYIEGAREIPWFCGPPRPDLRNTGRVNKSKNK